MSAGRDSFGLTRPSRTWCGIGTRASAGSVIQPYQDTPIIAIRAYLCRTEITRGAVIAADPAHWNVAASALVRAVVFDGLGLDHPVVRTLLARPAWEGGGGLGGGGSQRTRWMETRVSLSRAGVCQGCVRPRCA